MGREVLKMDFEGVKLGVHSGEVVGVIKNGNMKISPSVAYVSGRDKVICGISVAENIFLGQLQEFEKMLFLDTERLMHRSRVLLCKYGLSHIAPYQDAKSLTVGEKKLLELCRVLKERPPSLVLDGIFAELEKKYRDQVKKIIRVYVSRGGGVLFLTNDIDEAYDVCDRVVLVQTHRERIEKTSHELSCDVLLRGINLCGDGINNINFKLHKGEMLGFTGLSSSGIHTLSKMIYGMIRPERGRIYAKGKQIKSIKNALKNKIVYISGAFESNDIKRILCRRCEIVIADGVFCGRECSDAKEISELLQKKCRDGCGVVLISEDVEEQILLCDRIVVLYDGCICAELESPCMDDKGDIVRAVIGEDLEGKDKEIFKKGN